MSSMPYGPPLTLKKTIAASGSTPSSRRRPGASRRRERGRRQEARGVERDEQRAVGELPLLRARRAGTGEDPAENLDGERQAIALVGTRRQERARRLAVELLGIGRRLAAAVQHDP